MLTRKMKYIRIILQIIFCHPPSRDASGTPNVVPIKYVFLNMFFVIKNNCDNLGIIFILRTCYPNFEIGVFVGIILLTKVKLPLLVPVKIS